MKKLNFIILAFAMSILNYSVAQTVTASGTPLTLPCGGGNVDLSAIGNSTTPVFGDDFNNGSVASGWSASAAADFSNPCGGSVDGTTYLWMGSTTTAPREMTTASVDVSCGATVCFDFKFTCELCGDSAPCEGADYYNEGVSLQYSTDGGATWIDFAYFAPNGDILTSYPGGGVYSPGATGNTPFTTWGNYCFTIPAGAETANTMFQLHQWGSSGSNYDHWGIDNFYVYANPCAPYYYDWDHIPGSPDSPDVTTNVTQTTTFEVCYTNGTNSVCDQVTVVVESMDITGLTIGTEPCLGDDAGTVSASVTGGTGPYTYDLTGPTTASNGTGNFSNLPPGNYTLTVSDNTTCVDDTSFTIDPGPACCTVSATGTDLFCNGDNSGTATANPANGIAPYSYQWDDPAAQTTQTATGLAAGTYNVTITDFNGCTSTASVTITEPAVLNSSLTPTNPSCFGVCDGEVAVAAPTGGTSPYEYNLNGGTFGSTSTFTGLCDGTYNVTVQDDNGCQLDLNTTLNEPTDLTITEDGTSPATCGATNGELIVSAGGGTSPYQYDIGGAQQASGTFSNIGPGTYTVTVTDDNGCTEDISVTVGSSAGPAPFIDVFNDVACFGGISGSFTVGVNGGTSPYTYYLNPPSGGQPGNTFTGVQAGTHTVEVEDANGCTGTVDVTLSEPTAINYNVNITDASCNGVCDGEIVVNANGGTPPYEYSDDNGNTYQTSNTLTGLCAGTINMVVRDDNGCLVNSAETITEPTALSLNLSYTEPSCNGLSDGSITFGAGGGTPGYQYSIDNGGTFTGADPVTNVSAGFYNLVVEDANGCQLDDTLTVTQPPPFDFVYIANNPSNCGADDGSFEIAATNGAAPYDYSINGPGGPFQASGYFPDLYSGLYTLYVVDDNGCADSVNEALSDNVMTGFIDAQINATCHGSCDGGVNVGQNFGQAPFTYTLNTTGVSQVNNTYFGGLCAGTHYVTIEDDGLCIEIVQVDITEPDSITFDTTLTNITCPGGADGEVTLSNVVGGDGGPYTYSIDGTNFVASNTFTGLTPGTYTVWAQDGNGCLGNATFTLTEPSPWDVTINSDDLTCFQNNSGYIQVVAYGATPNYSYDLGGTVTIDGIYNGLSAGNHSITITDSKGCTFDTSHVLNEPTQLVIDNATATDALCNGSSDGEIDIDASGGTPNYLYSHDNGVTKQSSDVITGLPAGTYDLYVEDDNGCVATSTIVIGEPTQITMTMNITPETCAASNGEITVNANGGTPGYQYSNDGGNNYQAGNLFDNLQADDYHIYVEDLNGCTIDSIVTVTADDLPQIDNVVTTDVSCNAGADGDLTVTSSGGVGAHSYQIDGPGGIVGPQAGATFTGLTAGTYDVTVTDGNGCQATQQVVIDEPVVLTIDNVAIDDLLCNGDFTGEIDITVSGGTLPYNYSIDNGTTFQGGGTFSSIAAGTYDVVVEDGNGCTATSTETVNEPAALEWRPNFEVIDPVCANACDGIVRAYALGGTIPYTYSWGGNIAVSASDSATSVCAGTYSIILTDDNGCQIDTSVTLTDPPALVIDAVATDSVTCDEAADGIITVGNVSNGTPNYQYSIGGPLQASNTFNGLDVGNYDVEVVDDNGCTAYSNVTIYQPDTLVVSAPSNWPACYGENVTVQSFTQGGTQPYSYQWEDQNGNIENLETFNFNVTDTTTWTITITDANGCISVDDFDVMPSPPLEIQPVPDTVWICDGEEVDIAVSATGGQLIDFGGNFDYSYEWNTGVPADTLDSLLVSPSVATDYTVTVEDLCGQIEDTVVHVAIYPDPVVGQIDTVMGCEPEYVDFDDMVNNVLPGYTIEWDFGNGVTSTDPYPTDILYEFAGVYDVSVTITSDNGCVVSETTVGAVTINENPIPGFVWDPHAPNVMAPTVDIEDLSENAETYLYTFEDFGSSNLAEPSMTFPVEEETQVMICQYVTSIDNCTAHVCKPLTIQEVILFYVPNVFTPDGDDFNETFKPVFTSGVDPQEYHLTIFNRWGEVIFESYNYDYGWNGHFGDGGLVQDGVYVWQIQFGEKYSDDRQTHRGHVTVLK